MGSRWKRKIPECQCKTCVRWNVDVADLKRSFDWLRPREDPAFMRTLDENIKFRFGCELCGQDNLQVFFVPDVVREFFGIESLCTSCRHRLNHTQYEYQWSICWSSTPDDEIKWFLIAFTLERFRDHFIGNRGAFVMWLDCCVKGAHAQCAAVKPEPYKWPEPAWKSEPYEVEDLKIELKPEFRRPRVRARVIDVEST